ncbi:MAG: hypothetical protein M3410_16575 [Acidobacteriota bacterium]|nr:hypothetical protein [Acidobacteriota bacterium]
MSNIVLILLILITAIILVAIIGVLGFWMKGADSIALPGLGIIVATPLLLILLIVVEIILVILAAYLVRYIPIVRELLG